MKMTWELRPHETSFKQWTRTGTLGGRADGLHYLYEPATGDFGMILRDTIQTSSDSHLQYSAWMQYQSPVVVPVSTQAMVGLSVMSGELALRLPAGERRFCPSHALAARSRERVGKWFDGVEAVYRLRASGKPINVKTGNTYDLVVNAIHAYVKMHRRRRIDAALAGMAGDADYRKEAAFLVKGFEYSDWEALELEEKDLTGEPVEYVTSPAR